MSTYYLLVNEDKKEYIDGSDLGTSIKEFGYQYQTATLLGYLMLDIWGGCYGPKIEPEPQYNPQTHVLDLDDEIKSNFTFEGHWAGDTNICLISEHKPLYDALNGYGDVRLADGWVNISVPLATEWNHEIAYLYDDMQEWVKQHTYLAKVKAK